MIDSRVHGQTLLDQWQMYKNARPRDHVFDIQRDKDELNKWAKHLQFCMLWETENNIAETCYQFEYRLRQFKDRILIEVLTNGAA